MLMSALMAWTITYQRTGILQPQTRISGPRFFVSVRFVVFYDRKDYHYGSKIRIERIATIFNTFRNPDKETVLTPWRVVNMHMSDCLGGWCFWDEEFKQMLSIPRYVDQGKVTSDVFRTDSHILEINSKSGLYPLYVAYNIYRCRVEEAKKKYGEVGIGFAKGLWDATIEVFWHDYAGEGEGWRNRQRGQIFHQLAQRGCRSFPQDGQRALGSGERAALEARRGLSRRCIEKEKDCCDKLLCGQQNGNSHTGYR